MIIGVPREIKEHEYRVGMVPAGVRQLTGAGHTVLVENSAGMGSGFSDGQYREAGAELRPKKELFKASELIVKVKEPVPAEYELFQRGQALFTFLHLASAPELVTMLLEKKITAFAYETLELNNELPLLKPMSEVAGKMAPVVAAYYLQKTNGGQGLLMTGAEGVPPAKVLILGAGTVGASALQVAFGIGADVTVISRGSQKLERIDKLYNGNVRVFTLSQERLEQEVINTDVLIGAVLVTGAKAPKLVSRELVSRMIKGSVIVDVSVDQGGCVETTRPATHNDPVYSVDGVVHYTVANMPGAYPKTSTMALTSQTLKYIQLLAEKGINGASKTAPLKSAMNTSNGEIKHRAVSASL